MKDLLEELNTWGCHTADAIARIGSGRDYYLSLVFEYADASEISSLYRAILTKSWEEASFYACTLKGIYGDLGFDPIYDLADRIGCALKDGLTENLLPLAQELLNQEAVMRSILERWKTVAKSAPAVGETFN